MKGLNPGPSGHQGSPPQLADGGGGMSVARDDELCAALLRELRMNVTQVESIDLTIDLEGDAARRGGVDDGGDIEGVGLPAQDSPPCRMAKDVDMRILEGIE